jgi:uncharacterized Zn finger protein (UPF0148 family)
MQMTLTAKQCETCGQPIVRKPGETKHNFEVRRFCDRDCLGQFRAKQNRDYTKAEMKARKLRRELSKAENAKGKRAPVTRRYEANCPDYDTEYATHPLNVSQRKFERELDDKTAMTFSTRVIKPDDPDFQELCKKITPIHLIRKSERIITVQGEFETGPLGRRNERINESRG